MDNKKIRLLNSIIVSAITTVVFITSITIVADLIPIVKIWLKNTFTHHWVGKSILSLAIFAVFSVIFYLCHYQQDVEKTKKLLKNLLWTSIFGLIIIFLFFIWETFLK